MVLYNVKALVNYPEQSEVEIPDYNSLTHEGAYELVRRLLKTELEATSFVITIVVVKG